MSQTNYTFNVTYSDQRDYYYSSNKTGLRGYPDDVKPITLSDYQIMIADQYNPMFNSSGIWIWIYVCLVTLGLVGNVVNIVVFTTPSMVNPLNFLLTCLESANLVFYITFIPDLIALAFSQNDPTNYGWFLTFIIIRCVADTVMFMSNWCNVTIGLFRFIAVTWPLFAKKLCSNTLAKLVSLANGLVSVAVASVMYCLYVPIPYVVAVYEDIESEAPLFFTTVFGSISIISFKDELSEFLLESVLLLLSTSIPCLISALITLLLIGNLCVAKKRRRRLQENRNSNSTVELESQNENPEAPRGNILKRKTTDVETRLTITLLVVLVISNLSYFPTSITYFSVLTGDKSIRDSIIEDVAISRIGIILSNCLTFFVYVTMSQLFRKTLVDLVFNLVCKKQPSVEQMIFKK